MCATPATIAFGGVPTGVWKAILHDNAVGNIKNNGCISMAIDISANTGNKILATATFDANSVKICAVKHTINSRTIGGKSLRPTSELPNIADIPVFLPPSANAKPPPNKNIKPHGILEFTYFHVIKLVVG